MRNFFTILMLVINIGALRSMAATDSMLLTNASRLKDGVYLTFADFQRNSPSYRWTDIKQRPLVNDQAFLARLQSGNLLPQNDSLRWSHIWGFSYSGMVFLRLDTLVGTGNTLLFARLHHLGALCLFSYPASKTKTITVKAYNPQTGRPFRQSTEKRTETVNTTQMLDFSTGVVKDLEVETFKNRVEMDLEFYGALKKLNYDAIKERLLDLTQRFNERNKVYLPF